MKLKKEQAIVKFVSGRWIATFKKAGEKNFGHLGEAEDPGKAMWLIPYTGGFRKNIEFHITIEEKEKY